MTTTVEAALTFMLSALFLSFLLASFKKRQSGVVVCALGGVLLGLLLFSIPAAILVGIGSGCAAALFLEPPVMTQQGEKSS